MSSVTPASHASALVRLAEEAKRRGLRLFLEEATSSWFCTSHRAPDRLYRVTAHSCTCEGFLSWQRCTHLALLHAEMGWLADGDPEPPTPPVASIRPIRPVVTCSLCDGTGQEQA